MVAGLFRLMFLQGSHNKYKIVIKPVAELLGRLHKIMNVRF